MSVAELPCAGGPVRVGEGGSLFPVTLSHEVRREGGGGGREGRTFCSKYFSFFFVVI